MIRHLLHTEIDRQRWDSCIEGSVNRLPYAFSWWLDAVCEGWEALVQDDYTAVMPLTHNRKMGIDYLFQPFFTQQLGVFSPDISAAREINPFLSAIPASYRFVDIQLNQDNSPSLATFKVHSKINATLDLSRDYAQLSSHYHRNCRRNIRKALHANLMVKPGPRPAVFARFIQKHLGKKLLRINNTFYPTLQRLSHITLQNGTGEILGVYKPGDELAAAGWFVEYAGRYVFLVCASTINGASQQAMFRLVDHVLHEKAGTGLTFDFAGSNIPGVRYFNQGFGAAESYYPAVKRNNLPWPLNLFRN